MSVAVRGIKQGQKAMWTAGDYPEVARRARRAAADDGSLRVAAEYLPTVATKPADG